MISPPLLDNAATIYPPGIYPGAWLDENGEIVTDESVEPILLSPDSLWPPDLGDGPQVFAPFGVYQDIWLDENGEAVLDEYGEPILLGPDNYGDIEPPLIGDGPTLLAPVLTVGPVSLLAPLLGEPITYAPAIAAGLVALHPPLVGEAPSIYAPEVSGGQSAVIVSATIGLARGTMTIGCSPRSRDYWS